MLALLQPPEVLPEVPPAIGPYAQVMLVGDLLYVSGTAPRRSDGTYACGKVNSKDDIDMAKAAARNCALTMLAIVRSKLTTLNSIKRVVSVNGYVNCAPDFVDVSPIINSFSDVFIELFGEAGRHTRTSIGVASLPNGWAVEVAAVFQL